MKALFSNGFSLFFFIIFLLVILSSISALPTSGSTKDDPLKFILGEDNMGPWKNGISQSALAPGPASDVSESTLVLASNRTRRPDILNGFRRYQGGWDISNWHYWASVGFTGVAGFIIAVLWFVSFGLAIAVHFWCGWRIKIDGKGSNRSQKICLALLMFFTCAAVHLCWAFYLRVEGHRRTGCIVLSVGQDEFHGEVLHTLKYVVNQSDYTVQTLRNVTEYLSVAKTVNVAQVFLPSDVMNDIDKLNVDLNTAANTLTEKTTENSIKVKRVFNAVRSALIVVAVVMLLLALIGLVLSILGHQHAILILIISGWLLVAITFILCGLFVILNSAISDTCMAMGEWVENPQAESALSNILPCVDQGTTNKTLIQSKQIISNIVNVVNQFIYNYANANPPQGSPYYCNQSGPSVPPLCYPFDSQLNDTQQCGDQEVSFKNASLVWHKFRCEVSASGLCTTVGRLTPDIYSQLVAAVNESYALEHYVPPILSLQDCNFVRDTFLEITSSHCPSLEHYLKIVNAGLALISVGVLLCLVLWVIYANRPQREEAFAKLSLSIKLSRSWKDKFNNNRMNDTSSTALNGV